MQYALLIHEDESFWNTTPPEELGKIMAGYQAFGERNAGAIRRRRGAAADRDRDDRPRPRRRARCSPTGRSRRPASSSAASTSSTSPALDEAIEIAAQIPGAETGCVEVRPVMDVRRADRPEPRGAGRRPPVPARVGTGGRDPRAHHARPRPRRGGRAGRVRRRARALGGRRRARRPRRVDLRRPRATARSTSCAAAGGWPTPSALEALPAPEAADDDVAGRPARADLRLLPPGAGARGAHRADAAPRRRADDGARSRARSSSRETAMAQRLVRARAQAARRAASRSRSRSATRCPSGWPACCATLYLIFTEGYGGRPRRAVRRGDPARAAGRRAGAGGGRGARRCSRCCCCRTRAARRASPPTGRSVLLADQDRSRWDAARDRRGARGCCAAPGDGRYALQARIAAEHARGRDGLAPRSPRCTRELAPPRPEPGRAPQRRRRDRRGARRRRRAWPPSRRPAASARSTATTSSTPRARSCCGASAAATRRAAPTSAPARSPRPTRARRSCRPPGRS